MATIAELEQELTELDERIDQLKKEGDVRTDCRIGVSRPGGTAGPKARPQYRLIYKHPVNGKKTKYLSELKGEVSKARVEIARGKALRKLEKQRQSVVKQIDRLKTKIAALQG